MVVRKRSNKGGLLCKSSATSQYLQLSEVYSCSCTSSMRLGHRKSGQQVMHNITVNRDWLIAAFACFQPAPYLKR